MLMTANPCADAERWEDEQDRKDREWQERAFEMQQACTADDVDLAFEDGISVELMVTLARAVRSLKGNDHGGQNNGAYISAGRAIVDVILQSIDARARRACESDNDDQCEAI